MDEIAPATIKGAMYEVAAAFGSPGMRVDVPFQEFLRDTIKVAYSKGKLKGRINVGANRHMPRLLQYVRECEAETWWSDVDRGLRLLNAGGRGRVADAPTHPATLKLIVDLDNL